LHIVREAIWSYSKCNAIFGDLCCGYLRYIWDFFKKNHVYDHFAEIYIALETEAPYIRSLGVTVTVIDSWTSQDSSFFAFGGFFLAGGGCPTRDRISYGDLQRHGGRESDFGRGGYSSEWLELILFPFVDLPYVKEETLPQALGNLILIGASSYIRFNSRVAKFFYIYRVG